MSTAEVDRVILKLQEVGERVAALESVVESLDTKMDKYNGLKDKVFAIEIDHKRNVDALEVVRAKCQAVQDAKREKRIKWEVIYPSVVSTVTAALVLYFLLGR